MQQIILETSRPAVIIWTTPTKEQTRACRALLDAWRNLEKEYERMDVKSLIHVWEPGFKTPFKPPPKARGKWPVAQTGD
ncbi:hypothetical protein F4778DRAFT_157560 [Xylariomycetidae sp. FL2044]|nr:hypothetical protein F4778DRAFT_157560 [Xylariomycetidae sp. FL2044]